MFFFVGFAVIFGAVFGGYIAAGGKMAPIIKAAPFEIIIIGGAAIFEAGLDVATHVTLTEVDAERDAEVFFPAFDRTLWRETSATRIEADLRPRVTAGEKFRPHSRAATTIPDRSLLSEASLLGSVRTCRHGRAKHGVDSPTRITL